MTTTAHSESNYMAIFWWLLALTILEISVVYVGFSKLLVGFFLVSLALSKAALVAMFFMHLRFERLSLALIAIAPLLLCIFLLGMLLPDSSPLLRPAPGKSAETAAPAPVAS